MLSNEAASLERDVVTPLTTILLASSLRRTHGHPIFRITERVTKVHCQSTGREHIRALLVGSAARSGTGYTSFLKPAL